MPYCRHLNTAKAQRSQVITDNMSTVYPIPSLLAEDAIETIPGIYTPAVKECQVMFVEMNVLPGVS